MGVGSARHRGLAVPVTPHADYVACQCGDVAGDLESCRWAGPPEQGRPRLVSQARGAALPPGLAESGVCRALVDGFRVKRAL